ncbi:MAG: hypothetical protein AB7F98_15925 [Novosphingobium sp.]
MTVALLRNAYRDKGFALLPALLPQDVATGVLARMKSDFAQQGLRLEGQMREGPLLARAASEVYGFHYVPLTYLHWGMTRTVEDLVGEELVPSYCYFRLYRAGDICRVHGDRYACEHSISLTLAYSDARPWALEVSPLRVETPYQRADDSFGPEEQAEAVFMQPGDGVLYQGVHHHHARTTPNPNAWSAHLFLHWVSREGPYRDHAFDGQVPPASVTF